MEVIEYGMEDFEQVTLRDTHVHTVSSAGIRLANMAYPEGAQGTEIGCGCYRIHPAADSDTLGD